MELPWVLTCFGSDLCSKEVGDDAILIGSPYMAVKAQEAHAGTFLSAETYFAVEQGINEPFEAYGDFYKPGIDRSSYTVNKR